MLTSVPPALLHRVRDAAAYVHDLAELGLALLCPCDDNHGLTMRRLGGEDEHVRVHRFTNGATCWCGAEHWRVLDPLPAERLAGMARLDVAA
jgi:hypothetical protein